MAVLGQTGRISKLDLVLKSYDYTSDGDFIIND